MVVATAVTVIACQQEGESGGRILGQSWQIGNGAVTTYAEFAGDPDPVSD